MHHEVLPHFSRWLSTEQVSGADNRHRDSIFAPYFCASEDPALCTIAREHRTGFAIGGGGGGGGGGCGGGGGPLRASANGEDKDKSVFVWREEEDC